jgi:hypothetical protein
MAFCGFGRCLRFVLCLSFLQRASTWSTTLHGAPEQQVRIEGLVLLDRTVCRTSRDLFEL